MISSLMVNENEGRLRAHGFVEEMNACVSCRCVLAASNSAASSATGESRAITCRNAVGASAAAGAKRA